MEADFELFRQKGKSAIATISKRENNINIIENWIFKITQRENKNPDSFQTEYIRNILSFSIIDTFFGCFIYFPLCR